LSALECARHSERSKDSLFASLFALSSRGATATRDLLFDPEILKATNANPQRQRQPHASASQVPAFPCYFRLLDYIQLEYTMAHAITKDPNILGGEPVFRGTRVPFKILIEYLEGGDTLGQFLEQYPTVSRELAIAAIEEAKVSLVSQLR